MADVSEAILFNGPDPHEEDKYLLIKYFPKSGMEERVASFEGSGNNGMAYLDGNKPKSSLFLSVKKVYLLFPFYKAQPILLVDSTKSGNQGGVIRQ